MTLDLSMVGASGAAVDIDWTPRDVILYALGVGAGQADPLAELQFTTDNSVDVQLQVLPAFGVVQATTFGRRPHIGQFPAEMVLHGEQSLTLPAPLPTTGAATVQATVLGIYDQGRSAHVVTKISMTDRSTGRELLTTTATIVVRGEGGFGGERRTNVSWQRPEAAPDVLATALVRPDQALLYRLSGDHNPLHSDPTFARRAGFDRPILHGMCTFGVAGRLLINELCGGDAAAARAMAGRFSRPVRPGDTLVVKAWRAGDGEATFVVATRSGEVVVDRGHFGFAPV